MPFDEPFTQEIETTVSRVGENALLQSILSWLKPVNPTTPKGIGDDCAVLDSNNFTSHLLTIDSLVYGQHWDASVSAQAAGAKLLKRNISDIAAMGGQPHCAVIALLLPSNVKLDWLQRFYDGLRSEALKWGIAIVGGDIAQTTKDLAISLTLLGAAEQPLLRQGSKVGDGIYVTGELGGSRIRKHWDFQPRLKEAQWLAQHAPIHAMMDLSDGLAKDLPCLLPQGTVACLDTKALPISTDAKCWAAEVGRPPLEHALTDGEDYELLWTAPKDDDHWMAAWPTHWETSLTQIGEVIPNPSGQAEKYLMDLHTGQKILTSGGFEHFVV